MAKLALLGGEKTVSLDYETVGNRSMITQKGIDDAIEMMHKGQISSAPVVREFERRFAEFVGAQYCLSASNGTSSIQEALFACGVSPGDEVIAPSYTFWATCTPIIACGAKVVFCDVDPDTYTVDVADMEGRITPRTRAIILTHVWGVPCDMDAVNALAKKHGIAVIEDAAHAHGAAYRGKKCGVLGDAACFSLQGSKILVAGEGGMLTTNSREVYERALALGHYEKLEALPEDSAYRQYLLTGLGQKFRPHPLGIAIANAGLDILEERNALRNRNGMRLEKGIEDVGCIRPQKTFEGSRREYSYHFVRYMPQLNKGISTLSFVRALKAEGISVGVCGYGRLHKAPLFLEGVPYGSGRGDMRSAPVELPVTEMLAHDTFMLAPRFERECDALIDQYIDAVHKVMEHSDELASYDAQNTDQALYNTVSSRSINFL